jgi:hypothetical protein
MSEKCAYKSCVDSPAADGSTGRVGNWRLSECLIVGALKARLVVIP